MSYDGGKQKQMRLLTCKECLEYITEKMDTESP